MADKKKLKMLVDNHLNAGARINFENRETARRFDKGAKKEKLPRGKKIGGDGTKLGG